MSVYPRTAERKRIMQEYRIRQDEIPVGLSRPRPLSPKAQLEQEKRIRREIANSNERRRMQSINAGFQSLKTLLPHHAGEKLSKAAILQQTSEYIASLERDKTTVMAENDRLRQQLMNISNTLNSINAAVAEESPPPKRKKRDTESSDEGIGLCEESSQLDEMRKKLLDIQLHFDQEKRMRLKFEDRSRALEAKLQKLSSHMLEKETVMSLSESDDKPSQPLFNSSMSRRNLETIVEAIRHLEGDRIGPYEEHAVNVSQAAAMELSAAPPAHQHDSSLEQQQQQQLLHSSRIIPPYSSAVGGHSEDSERDVLDSNDDPDDYKSNDGSMLSSPVDDIDDNSELLSPVDFSATSIHHISNNSNSSNNKNTNTSSFTTTTNNNNTTTSTTSLSTSSSLSTATKTQQKPPQQQQPPPQQQQQLQLQHQLQQQQQQQPQQPNDCLSVVKANPSSCFSDKYSTAASLLHRPPPYINQMYQRPGVIVHKS